jgi:hypothetical protein
MPNITLAIRIDRVVFLKAEVCFIAVPRFNPAKLLNRDVTLAQESYSVRCRTKHIVEHNIMRLPLTLPAGNSMATKLQRALYRRG